jgi:sterol desaturase/sphingolipid hydroxylase (fatty acid hydroxylase superfamily)
MLFFFLGALATPLGALFYFLLSPNTGWLFAATAVGYFLTYEWLHLAYHVPESSFAGRLPGMKTLRRLHTAHHQPDEMLRCNFNITFPICDWLFGTYTAGVRQRSKRASSREPSRSTGKKLAKPTPKTT